MLEYRVVKEHELSPDADWENPGFAGGYVLQPDELIYDGDIEPDIVAALHQNGVIERTDGETWDADPDEPDPDAPDDEDEQ